MSKKHRPWLKKDPFEPWMHALLAWFHDVLSACEESAHHERMKLQHICSLRTGGLWLTKHSVERFVERHRPEANRNKARLELLGLAARIETQGAEYFTTTGDVRMVVRNRRVVTVLP